jgi:hypothetical protein
MISSRRPPPGRSRSIGDIETAGPEADPDTLFAQFRRPDIWLKRAESDVRRTAALAADFR